MGVGNLTAQQASANAEAWQRAQNNRRRDPIPKSAQRVMGDPSLFVHIFSVSPFDHQRDMGNWGSFVIPACPKGEEYVEFQFHYSDGHYGPIPGVLVMPFPISEDRSANHEEDGLEWAQKLLGIDMGLPRAYALTNQGVFIGAGKKPTAAELAEANKLKHNELRRLVQEARDWSVDPILKKGIDLSGKHGMAAQILGLTDEPWILANSPEGRKKCPMCGSYSDPDVIKCKCGDYIFDPVRYKEILAQQNDLMEAAPRKQVKA